MEGNIFIGMKLVCIKEVWAEFEVVGQTWLLWQGEVGT